MAYDIPDEIKYREKIVGNLDSRQLLYAIAFGVAALLSYRLPFEGDLKLVLPAFLVVAGIGFIFLGGEERIKDILAYSFGLRSAANNSNKAQKFFEVKEIRNDLCFLDDGRILAILEVQPVNFALLDEGRRKATLANYKAFLNQLTSPIQLLIRTKKVSLTGYFEQIEAMNRNRELLMDLYSDFRVFQEDFLDTNSIKERRFYAVISTETRKKSGLAQEIRRLNELVTITNERLSGCGLETHRLSDGELTELILSYADSADSSESPAIAHKEGEISDNQFRNILTPSFDIRKDHAIVNGEFHKIVRIGGYPREVEDGWLQAFLSKNENYDISIHIAPSAISTMLVYLHNQIIQQASDLLMSTAKGTPNPSLEIKKADTTRVYDSLYKGKEKLFGVSLYVDAKADRREDLNLLVEKCKSNLNAQLMIPKSADWRMADGIKSTLPLAKDLLETRREFLTDSLAATFPFISPVDTKKRGILFAHDTETLNPIFLDHEGMSNKHFFVIGISGSGKSYTSKYLIMQQLFKEDAKVFILDPNGEYTSLCNSLQGQIIELSRDSDSIINIFDLAGEDFGNKMLGLISAFDIIVGGLTESQKGVINKALLRAYAVKGIVHDDPSTWNREAPKFSDLRSALQELKKEYSGRREHLQDPSVEALLNRVEMYCDGGIFGFLDSESRIDITNGIVCFDLSALPNAVKTLMMFATLENINREIRKDRKAKIVLIDEGWSLLRSKEAAGYILDLVKTSRKFNASLGFVTQEIEDLLRSRAGRSILNTASVKILMRQNPTNIGLICEALHLNEQARNYLLTAQSGFGLLISEHNTHKFFVKASDKLHALMTTNPKEYKKSFSTVQKKEKKDKKFDLSEGLYLKNILTSEQQRYLLSKNYALHKDRISRYGGSAWYLVKKRNKESPEHAFLCWKVYELLREKYNDVQMFTNKPGDVVVTLNSKKIAFEIETGENFKNYDEEGHERKFDNVKKEYSDFFIIVTNWQKKARYERFGKVISRTEINKIIDELAQNNI